MDLADGRVLRDRSWRWLRVRIEGLFTVPPGFSPDGALIHSTRTALALFPPDSKRKG